MNTSLAKYSTFAEKDARISELEVELSTAAKVVRKCHDERDAAWTKLAAGEVRIGELDRKCKDSIRAIVFERTIAERAESALSASIEQGKVLGNEVQVLREALEEIAWNYTADAISIARLTLANFDKARAALAQVSGGAD